MQLDQGLDMLYLVVSLQRISANSFVAASLSSLSCSSKRTVYTIAF